MFVKTISLCFSRQHLLPQIIAAANYCYIATKIGNPQFRLTGALKFNESNYSWSQNGMSFIAIYFWSEIANV